MNIDIDFGNIEIDFGHYGFKVEANLTRDGDLWCVLFGDDFHVGISGSGYSIPDAVLDFKDSVRSQQQEI